jgi:hypothetical protein
MRIPRLPRPWFFAAFLALMSFGIHAQEIVLKDGKRLAWKSITDGKDSVELVTLTGEKLSIKKTDVSKIILSSDQPVMLTGASMTFDKKSSKTSNLLASLNTEKQALAGEWRVAGGFLSGAAVIKDGLTHAAKVAIVDEAPEEYELHLTVERASGKEFFGIGLVGGGKQFMFVVDVNTKITGLWLQDGKGADQAEDAKIGPILEDKRPRNIDIFVRQRGLVVQLDGRDYYSWSGDWNRLSLADYHQMPKKKALFLWVGGGQFRIRKALLVTSKD